MFYTPKFCCECREKIERTVWRPWTNRRFCQLCATNFGISDTLQIFALIALSFISIIGVANILRKPEKELIISSNQNSGNVAGRSNSQIQSANSERKTSQNFAAVKETDVSGQTKQQVISVNRTATANQPVNQTMTMPPPTATPVSFCGAPTKKGSPCTRRVKNGGRCWQHIKQSVMPPQKLSGSG